MTVGNSGGPDQQQLVAADQAYEVGYKRPPKASQFRPGRSGNPKGRPKRTVSPMAQRRELYNALVQVRVGDKVQKIPRFLAAEAVLCAQALKGNLRAVQLVAKNAKELGVYDEPPPSPYDNPFRLTDEQMEKLTDEELDMIVNMFARLKGWPPDWEERRRRGEWKPPDGSDV